jgi:hypothetical protein
MLTAAEVVAASGGTGLEQIKDEMVNGQPGTDRRDFGDPGHIFFIELQLYVTDGVESAVSQYPSLRDSIKSGFTKVNQTLAPAIGSATSADEWIGLLSGRPGIAVTFQQGPFLCAEFAVSNAGFVTDTIGPVVAVAESHKIHTLAGS